MVINRVNCQTSPTIEITASQSGNRLTNRLTNDQVIRPYWNIGEAMMSPFITSGRRIVRGVWGGGGHRVLNTQCRNTPPLILYHMPSMTVETISWERRGGVLAHPRTQGTYLVCKPHNEGRQSSAVVRVWGSTNYPRQGARVLPIPVTAWVLCK